MADITLSTGQEITLDLNKITRREFKSLFDEDQQDTVIDELFARVAGIEPDDIGNMGYEDWRRFRETFWKKASRPLEDPNA